ncbi:hypothetical protein [Streptomyces sp. NPDC053427]|uniref:hypothetical protein n=1 Tax=Streptomyces sp. NPDC053427 TaxID=3365701 RepID=UPI0037D8B37E
MKIAKAAAGVVGVALVLGAAASPALAAPGPRGGEKPLKGSSTVGKTTLAKPAGLVDVDAVVGKLGNIAKKLNSKNDLASKTNALGAARGR